ncbi:VOC family protein [Litorimonas haliclonae]|uniref:VOC family protein n=1 Tax=Litorimonas haliclonae TaxID=2081977 RepID=UPI0039F0B8E1
MAGLQKKVRTCLWFEGNGREAAEFYVSLLPDSHIDEKFTAYEDEPLVVEFTLAGAPMMTLDGGPMFKHTEAASISVLTEDQAETDKLWEALTEEGEESMCGWLTDRYGVSWQITPKRMVELVNHNDQAAATRAREAMFQMKKINIAALEAAFLGE